MSPVAARKRAVMIRRDWDEAKNRDLLRRSFEALRSGGAVAWLEAAGFRDIETVWFEVPAANGVVIGRKR